MRPQHSAPLLRQPVLIDSRFMRTRWSVAAGLVAISLTLGGEASNASPQIPHYTIWIYKMTVGTKGALTYDGHYYPPSNPSDAGYGDVRDEHFVGSFSVDTTFRNLIFARGARARRAQHPRRYGAGGPERDVDRRWDDVHR
jgi:hypothetical protein